MMRIRSLAFALAGALAALAFQSGAGAGADALSGQVSSALTDRWKAWSSAPRRRARPSPSRSPPMTRATSASRRRSSSPAATRSPFAPSAMTSKGRRTPTSPPARRRPPTSSSRPTKNLAKQMSNAEWLASFPGTDHAEEGAAQLHQLPQPRPHRELAIMTRAVRRRCSTGWSATTRAARRSIRSGSSATPAARSARRPA